MIDGVDQAGSHILRGADVPLPTSSVVDLFSAVALGRRDSPAVVDGDASVTYGTLMDLAARGTAALQAAHSIVPGDVVALSTDRSVRFVAAVLSIFAAGAIYLPISPALPAERSGLMLRDAGAKLLISEGGTATWGAMVEPEALFGGPHTPFRPHRRGPTDIAYIAYTSGTTGVPKGVPITHGGLANRITWMKRYYGFGEQDALLLKCAIDFDPSLFELFLPLISGGRACVVRGKGQMSASLLIEQIERHRITFINLVPLVLRQLLHAGAERCSSLRHIVCGGEAWEGALIGRTQAAFPMAMIYNGYGPTEASIGVTVWRGDGGAVEGKPPIGKPIDNVQVMIVDAAGEPVRPGETGELWIGGVAVSPGYLGGDPDGRFVDVDVGSETVPYYRTGDMAFVREDGNIMFVGRTDNQVKLNGMRVELGEIEAVANSLDGVVASVAQLFTRGSVTLLALFYVSRAGDLDTPLRAHLARHLKPEQLPHQFRRVEAMPYGRTGKIDRSALRWDTPCT